MNDVGTTRKREDDMPNRLKITVTGYIDVPDDALPTYDATTIEEAAANQQRWFAEDGMNVVEIVSLFDENGTITVEPDSDSEPVEVGDMVSFMFGSEVVHGTVERLRPNERNDGTDAVIVFQLGGRTRQTMHRTVRNVGRLTRVVR